MGFVIVPPAKVDVRRNVTCAMARRCSRCGEEGHNARTCPNEYFRQPRRRSSTQDNLRCLTCGGSGVLPCKSCKSPMERENLTVKDLCSLSKFQYKMRGKVRSEICERCGGSSLIVCPQCTGVLPHDVGLVPNTVEQKVNETATGESSSLD